VERAPVRVESERALRSGEAILDVVDGVAKVKEVPVRAPSYEGIREVTVDELTEYGLVIFQGRWHAPNPQSPRHPARLASRCGLRARPQAPGRSAGDPAALAMDGRWLASADTPSGPSMARIARWSMT